MTTLKTIVVSKDLRHVGREGERVQFHVQKGARLEYFLAAFGAAETQVRVELAGEAAQVESHVIFFGNGTQEQSLRIEHVHLGRETRSNLTAKGAVKDSARSRFYGLVRMEAGSKGAVGSLNEHNLLLSPGAKIEAVPALEIEHDDVQASHAATLEKVDGERLFYLLSRGLSEPEAMELLVEGFFKDALEILPEEERDAYYSAILKKL